MGAGGAMQGASAFFSMSQAYSEGKDLRVRGDYEEDIGKQNARYANIAGADAISRGDKDAADLIKDSKRMIGSQRAALAANGIDPNDTGTSLDLQTDTAELAAKDALTIKNNAWREAWGYRVEATNSENTGKLANIAAKQTARNTLITAGIKGLSGAGSSVAQSNAGVTKRY